MSLITSSEILEYESLDSFLGGSGFGSTMFPLHGLMECIYIELKKTRLRVCVGRREGCVSRRSAAAADFSRSR